MIKYLIMKYTFSFQEGGPIGLIENGDIITIDVQKRRMDVQVTEEEMNRRKRSWVPPPYKAKQGALHKVCVHLHVL